MLSIPIIIKENDGVRRQEEPVKLGVPFPRGTVKDISKLTLTNDKNKLIPLQITTSTTWHDGSCRWAMLHFQTSIEANTRLEYQLNCNDADKSFATENNIARVFEINELTLDSSDTKLQLNRNSTGLVKSLEYKNQTIIRDGQCKLLLTDNQNQNTSATVTSIKKHQAPSNLVLTTDISGHFYLKQTQEVDKVPLKFCASVSTFNNKPWVKWDITIHNPNAAQHKNGLWDLGDHGSYFFKELSFVIERDGTNKKVWWKSQPEENWLQAPSLPLTIHQESSGGNFWNSCNQVDYTGTVAPRYKGYKVESNNQTIDHSDRTSPLLKVENGDGSLGIHMPKFWQNFPKALSADKGQIKLSLFPICGDHLHELQGGESKTHTFYLFFKETDSVFAALTQPVECHLTSEWIAKAQALPYLGEIQKPERLDSLINKGIESEDSFFNKREKADEYGWRNFGDLHADHESLYHEGNINLVSHYNNQYDPIYGFARQYLLTGDRRWFELMDDLATHVKNIDIYNTNLDRAEYNNGLFWHTDHYLDTFTSSHRTYSIQQDSIYDNHGGGPGGQHCYTTGLLYHYLLTGSDSSKTAVLSLTQWITYFYDGSGSLLEMLLSFKNRHLEGYKNPFSSGHQYPLDRGIGNYITALLNSFILTNDLDYILRVEAIIKNTVHPQDDLENRNFNDVETTWFYTVFFQALVSYLQIKAVLKKFDDNYHYAKDALLHYANWMCNNEQPYLSNAKILEFPNHTWVAQDIRKANLFYAAYYYSNQTNRFLERGDEFYNYVVDELETNDEATFTRILAIFMQNHGPHNYFKENSELKQNHYSPAKYGHGTAPIHRPGRTPWIFAVKAAKHIRSLSIQDEVKWFRTRSGKSAEPNQGVIN